MWTLTLGVAGGISGFLSMVAVSASQWTALVLPGLLFAGVLAIYLWNAGNPRSIGAIGAVVCWSLAAYWIATMNPTVLLNPAAFFAFQGNDVDDFRYADTRAVLVASGAIGAAIVSAGFLSLVRPRASAFRVAIEAVVCACLGGAVAHVGTTPAVIGLAGVEWKGFTTVVWQAGLACLLGGLCVLRADRRPMTVDR